jgi:hypothetical protein
MNLHSLTKENMESFKKIALFAYLSLCKSQHCECKESLRAFIEHLNNVTSKAVDKPVIINDVCFSNTTRLDCKDIVNYMQITESKHEFFYDMVNDKKIFKSYIDEPLKNTIVQCMAAIVTHEGFIDMQTKMQEQRMFAMCNHVLHSILFCDNSPSSRIVNIILPETLSVSGANVHFSFTHQIPHECEYYMLMPYSEEYCNESYKENGAPILQYINQLLHMEKGKCNVNENCDAVIYLKDVLANAMNKWITDTIFMLFSDSGKYYGSSICAAPGELYKQYVQTINSALIGSPISNIIQNTRAIRNNVENGVQENNCKYTLGMQFVDAAIENHDIIGKAILSSDSNRRNEENNENHEMFKRGDMLTIFVAISGNINNHATLKIGKLFAKNIDPDENNTNSFKQYIINHQGNHIKQIVYAIVVPLDNSECE